MTGPDDGVDFMVDSPTPTFEVDQARRTIFGLAVPFGVPTHSDGSKFQFSQGVLQLPDDPSKIKLLISHDRASAVGKATELREGPDGLWARFSVARGARGDEALSMAEDGVWDGLVTAVLDIQSLASGTGSFVAVLLVDGVAQSAQVITTAPSTPAGVAGGRGTAAAVWRLNGLAAGSHTVKVQARQTGTGTYRVNLQHSTLSYVKA